MASLINADLLYVGIIIEKKGDFILFDFFEFGISARQENQC